MARAAIVDFERAREAERRVAGVPWAARAVRMLADAGYDKAHLVVPPLTPATLREIARLAPDVEIELGTGDIEGERVTIPRPSGSEILRATGKPTDGPVSRFLNRPISRAISRLLLPIPGIRPIHATLVNAAIAVLMLVALVAGGAPGLIFGALLFQAASVIDGVDGEIARATFRVSRAGAILDSVIDVATIIFFIVGLTINLATRGDHSALIFAGWGVGLHLLGLGVIAWHGSRTGSLFNFNFIKRHYLERASGRWLSVLMQALTIVSSRDFLALLFAVLVLIGLPMAVLYIFATAATIWLPFVLGSMRLLSSEAAEA